jgi:hypothetical protein
LNGRKWLEQTGKPVAITRRGHVWAWWLSGDGGLRPRERAALDRLAERRELKLCAISLCEAQMAFAKGRFKPLDPAGGDRDHPDRRACSAGP